MLEMLSYLKMFTVCLSCKKILVIFHRKVFELYEKDDFDLEHLGTEADIEENDLLLDIIKNLQAWKSFLNNP